MAAKKRRNIKRKPAKAKINFSGFWSALKRIVISITIIGLLGVVGFYTSTKAIDFLNRPIEQLLISGDFIYTDAQKVESLIRSSTNQSFVKEHLTTIRKAIEETPWIDSASLTRHWPNTLEVMVVEQKPIARWGDQGFVNYRGELVKTQSLEAIQHLPVLFGEELEAAALMQQYKILTPLLLNNGLAIQSLNKDALGVWQLELNNGWQLILGRNSLAEKIQLINHVLDQRILLVKDAIDTIDMRYENGFAIAWDKGLQTILDEQNEIKENLEEPS